MSKLATLDGARKVLTVDNKINRLSAIGSLAPDTQVYALRADSFGHYMPCLAHVVKLTRTGRVMIDLWSDRSERVCVSQKAILWAPRVVSSAHTGLPLDVLSALSEQ